MTKKEFKNILVIFVRNNILYILSGIIFFILLFWYVPVTIQSIIATNDKIEIEKQAVTKLQKQVLTLNKYTIYDLDQLTLFVTKLVPEKADSFSIHTTLDSLSEQNDFVTSAKNVPADFSNISEDIPVTISLLGSLDNLPAILSNHRYKYGRFFTIESVDVNLTDAKATLKLKFYSRSYKPAPNPIESLTEPNQAIFSQLATELKNSNLIFEDLSNIDVDYIPSRSPFGSTAPPNLKKK